VNTFFKLVLRIAAVLIGTTYFCGTYFLVSSALHLDNFGSIVGYGAAALAQFLVGGFLVGLGLRVWRIAR
jgi:hypothetical protein